jgi:hypothetical protein
MVSKFKVGSLLVLGAPPHPFISAIARIDRMGQTKPTEGMYRKTCSIYLLLNLLPSSLLLLRRGYYLLAQDVICLSFSIS